MIHEDDENFEGLTVNEIIGIKAIDKVLNKLQEDFDNVMEELVNTPDLDMPTKLNCYLTILFSIAENMIFNINEDLLYIKEREKIPTIDYNKNIVKIRDILEKEFRKEIDKNLKVLPEEKL